MAEVKVTKAESQELAKPSFWDEPFWTGSPFSTLRRFSRELDRFFPPTFRGFTEMEGWAPVMEVIQRNGTLAVKAELPGMKKEDIHVELTDDALVIQGERKHETEEKKEGYFRSERSYGKFYRSIPLPEGATIDKAKAEYTNGVLEVTVPVPETKKQRREIPVQTKAAA